MLLTDRISNFSQELWITFLWKWNKIKSYFNSRINLVKCNTLYKKAAYYPKLPGYPENAICSHAIISTREDWFSFPYNKINEASMKIV